MTTSEVQTGMSLEEYLARSSETRFEIIDGEIIVMSPNVMRHMRLSKRLFMLMLPHEGEGELFFELPYVLEDSRKWVRGALVPDLMVVTAERMQAYNAAVVKADNKPLMLVPDLTVEIISPSDRYSNMVRKVLKMLSDGVRAVWLVDPANRKVQVFSGAVTTILDAEDTLDGGDILPGFSVTVAELFA
jgi:Uma2 family endonuclease